MPASSKNECPGCGGLKTSWSEKCNSCEHSRKRILGAIQHKDSDIAFLQRYDGWSLSRIAHDRNVSRERARQLKANAYRRLEIMGVA